MRTFDGIAGGLAIFVAVACAQTEDDLGPGGSGGRAGTGGTAATGGAGANGGTGATGGTGGTGAAGGTGGAGGTAGAPGGSGGAGGFPGGAGGAGGAPGGAGGFPGGAGGAPGGAGGAGGAPGGAGGAPGGAGGGGGTTSECSDALAALRYDFEGSDQGFTHRRMDGVSGTWTFDHWERGTATSGPGSCHAGSGCWATNLDGNYISCQRAELVSPQVDLSACAGTDVKLVFYHHYDFWTASYNGSIWYDGGLVEINGGTGWAAPALTYPGTIRINPRMGLGYECLSSSGFYVHNKPGYVGANTGWERVEVSIPAAYLTDRFQVRFAYATGVSAQTSNQTTSMLYTRPGWYIDDVTLEAN
jgi:hypothetical protein